LALNDFAHWADIAGKLAGPSAATREVERNDLEILGDKHKPSKRNHNYLRYYGERFERLRHSARRLLEIGVETPRSLELWEDYFPNAQIFGMDIDPSCSRVDGGRKKVFIGDQQDPAFLARVVAETGGEFDVIVDDGLHSEKSILTSFAHLFPAVRQGGLYAVEDIVDLPNVVRFFSLLAERVSYWPPGFPKSEWAALDHLDVDWLTRNVIGVSFYRFICFVERGPNPEINPYLMSRTEFYRRKDELRGEVNAAIDDILAEGGKPTPDAVSARIGNRGLTTIREEMKKRGIV
jgi:hypothetical protein